MDKPALVAAAAVGGALVWWLENGQPSSAEQLAVWLSQLSMTTAGLTPDTLPGAEDRPERERFTP